MNKSKKKKRGKLKKTPSKLKKLDLTMCRICNDEKGEVPIFDNMVQPDIPEEILNFSGVTVSKSDKLPQQMCQSCLDLLNGCIMFRDMCQKTNKDMIELCIKKAPSPYLDSLDQWQCKHCNQIFEDLKSYNAHSKDCGNKARRRPRLPKQEKLEKMQSFLCDTCGKTARSKASLLVHMGTHENIFPFKCDECPYMGRTMDLLKVHKRSHLVDKPFKCTQCPKATTTSSNLAKHMRHVHSTTRPFKCSYCDKAFSYQHDMKRHIKDIHLRTSTVECDVCFKKFNTKKILQGHRWKIHKIKGERQGRLPSYLQVRGQGHCRDLDEHHEEDLDDQQPCDNGVVMGCC
ncbi:zinc-finger associated domain (zf-AD) domain-containing protein [Phthorimaea operculella]|nr:zinc-finger associated domain (zf-AD) domain-containing protein [Phthorimaea operculella]